MKEHLNFVENIVKKGGLEPAEYVVFDQWLHQLAVEVANKKLTPEDLHKIRSAFGEALSPKTMQGFGFTKPHGYAGDFEMLDKIYLHYMSHYSHLRKWDEYFHSTAATNAVRNRKIYFLELLHSLESLRVNLKFEKFDILNVASGSGRDLLEFFQYNSSAELFFDCIEYDEKAITYAKNLCSNNLSKISFYRANALKFMTDKKYRLIWSAGLFDYFDDETFKVLLTRYYSMLSKDGELVIGNFSDYNPTRNYMEIIGEWFLNHRSKEKLIALAHDSGLSASSITVKQEPLGVNLFLHIKA